MESVSAVKQNVGRKSAGNRREESVAEMFAGNKNSLEQLAMK